MADDVMVKAQDVPLPEYHQPTCACDMCVRARADRGRMLEVNEATLAVNRAMVEATERQDARAAEAQWMNRIQVALFLAQSVIMALALWRLW